MKKRILIAEDELETRELLASIATHLGYDVTSAIDGVELLAFAMERNFDLIITDLMMENLNGASATEIIKILDKTTPVIALTALPPQDLSLVQDKFIRIFHKPYNIVELFSHVESLLEK